MPNSDDKNVGFLVLAIWIICVIINFGATFAYFQGKFPEVAEEQYREHLGFATFVGLAGPLGLPAAVLGTGFCEHGLKYW